MSPTISIIIPVYNVEPYLRVCLDSVLAQTYTDWEAILVNDGSKDKSGVICDEYAKKDSRFVVVHKQNEGVAKARITAFDHSKGDLITFIDADDYVDHRYLDILYDCIKKYDVDASCCQYYKVSNEYSSPNIRAELGFFDKVGIRQILQTDFWYNVKTHNSGMPLYLCCKMIKREYAAEVLNAGDGYWYGEDQIGTLLLMYNISSIFISKEPLYYYVFHEGQAIKVMGKDRWDANVRVWNRMIALDKNDYLEGQISNRIFHFTINFLDNTVKTCGYKDFKFLWYYILQTPIFKNYCISEKKIDTGRNEKIKLYIIRHDYSMLYYYLMKIRLLLVKLI